MDFLPLSGTVWARISLKQMVDIARTAGYCSQRGTDPILHSLRFDALVLIFSKKCVV